MIRTSKKKGSPIFRPPSGHFVLSMPISGASSYIIHEIPAENCNFFQNFLKKLVFTQDHDIGPKQRKLSGSMGKSTPQENCGGREIENRRQLTAQTSNPAYTSPARF
jgi:hypothetical protein